MNPSFTVIDPAANVAARGIAGGKPIELAAGDFLVKVGVKSHPICISPEQQVQLKLE